MHRGSIVLAVANLRFGPSYFFGMDPALFYAANGWGSTASIGFANMVRLGVIGRAVLKSNTAPAVNTTSSRAELTLSGGY